MSSQNIKLYRKINHQQKVYLSFIPSGFIHVPHDHTVQNIIHISLKFHQQTSVYSPCDLQLKI